MTDFKFMDLMKIVIIVIPFISMLIVWYVHSLKTKTKAYWICVIIVNILWTIYSIFILLQNNSSNEIMSGMFVIIFDNFISIGIAIYGLNRIKIVTIETNDIEQLMLF
jgi:hypothetical protein